MKSRHVLLLLLILLQLAVQSVCATTFIGKVVAVTDGDTITVLVDKKQVKVRLHGIDCPEKTQDFGTQAKKFTSQHVFGKVEVKDKDHYGRTVGIVRKPDGSVINHLLVSNGLAWWYRKYAPNDLVLKILEIQAKKVKIGIWSKPNPIPPWQFRRGSSRSYHTYSATSSISKQPQVVNSLVTVYVTRTGEKYHHDGCRYLARSHITISISDATKRGYAPCKVCRP